MASKRSSFFCPMTGKCKSSLEKNAENLTLSA
jgi:hypothetical protein